MRSALAPGQPGSGGSQFFTCVVDPAGARRPAHHLGPSGRQHGDVVTHISETPVDAEGRAAERVVVRRVTIRDQPPPDIPPFTTETDVAARIEAAPTEAETPVDRVEIIDAEMTRR